MKQLKITLIFLATAFFCKAQVRTVRTQEAFNHFVQLETKSSLEAYGKILSDPAANVEDRTSSALMIAKMKWRFYNEHEGALALLESVKNLNSQASSIEILKSRIYESQGDLTKSVQSARTSVNLSDNKIDSIRGISRLSETLYNMTITNIANGDVANLSSDLDAIEQTLTPVISSGENDTRMSALLMATSLFQGKNTHAFRYWSEYYALSSDSVPKGILEGPYYTLKNELLQNSNRPDKRLVALALFKSGFIDVAAQYCVLNRLEASNDPELAAYIVFRNSIAEITEMTNQFYREESVGEGNKSEFRKNIQLKGTELMKKLNDGGNEQKESQPSSVDDMIGELDRRFNTVVRVYEMDNKVGIHLGQAIVDETVVVHQYGYEGKLRFVKVDHMASNGFEPWYWDGALTHGGWVNSPNAIYQVRLNDAAYSALRTISNMTQEKINQQIITLDKSDLDRAAKTAVAYFPGMHLKIRTKALSLMYERANQLHPNNYTLMRSAFVRMFNDNLDFGTLQHEARHAIDKTIKNRWKDEDFEFRAKLSEVTYSKNPWFTLGYGGILSARIGDKSAHGQADERILKGIGEWICDHAKEINDYDSKTPCLLQLDKLTQDQLVAAFRSLDPLSK